MTLVRQAQIGNFYVTFWNELHCTFWKRKFFWQYSPAGRWIFIQSSTGLLSIPYCKPSETWKTFIVHIPITEQLESYLGYRSLTVHVFSWPRQLLYTLISSTISKQHEFRLWFLPLCTVNNNQQNMATYYWRIFL